MSLTTFIGRCPHCGHDHGENTLFDVARGILTPAQQAQLNEQFANYAKQKPHLYGGCIEANLHEQVEKLAESVVYWKADSAAAWDKCEERRIENEKLTKERDEAVAGFEAAASEYRNLKLQMQEIINVC